MSNNINTKPQQHQEKLQLLQQRIDELRVAYQELTTIGVTRNKKSGTLSLHDDHHNNSSINVYIQLSSGAVAMHTDRAVAEARISRQLQRTRDEFETLQQEQE